MENYDAVGAWRTQEAAWEDPSRSDPSGAGRGGGLPMFPIDARFELPIQSEAAKRLVGPEAVRAELLHRREDFARGFTEKMMIYALGRGLAMSDHRSIEGAVEALKRGDDRLHALIHAVVQSAAFQTR